MRLIDARSFIAGGEPGAVIELAASVLVRPDISVRECQSVPAAAIKYFDSQNQANAVKRILKPWIGAQRMKAWPHEDPRAKALRIRFFEPSHCLILLV